MSIDVKLFCACNHIIDDEQFETDKCPRCYGKGYYFDIFFDGLGQTVLTNKSLKLQQEALKIIIEQRGNNEFHPLWGSEWNNLIGTKNLDINKTKLEIIIRKSLEYLKNVQISERDKHDNLTDEEIIDEIEYVSVTPLGATSYNIDVKLSNKMGEIMSQSIIL